MSQAVLPKSTAPLTHPMAPMVERFAVPLAYVALGVIVGMYLSRSKKVA